ncbi:MAG TPA: GrpB family protein [Candidatus Dormibacteraeota bacterium]
MLIAFAHRSRSLRDRLLRAGANPDLSPIEAWSRLRAAEGMRTTVIDLYRLVSEPRGLEPHELPVDERFALARSAMPIVWPGFQTTTGTERIDPVAVVAYDPGWPARFEGWRDRIVRALGPTALRVEHVGSTSVPGLAAKPTIDIQVSVQDIETEELYVPQLEGLGLQLRSRDRLHRYFRPPKSAPRDVHVHVCDSGSDWERDHLLFRDYLREHADARDRYSRVKLDAARLWADDRWGYTDAKSEVVLDILEAAEASRATS